VPGVLDRSAADHEAIVSAIAAHDADAAAAAMLVHVENIRATTMAVMESATTLPFKVR
jgi:GntR family transcriptional repressor for pyruvate dehydrogenase complex